MKTPSSQQSEAGALPTCRLTHACCRVEVSSLQGLPQAVLTFTEKEGQPVMLHSHGDLVVAATRTGLIKVWSASALLGPQASTAPVTVLRLDEPKWLTD